MTRTTFNFIRGMGAIFDLAPSSGPSRVGRGLDLNRTDAEALHEDWQHVAEDFRAAFDQTSEEVGDHVESKQTK